MLLMLAIAVAGAASADLWRPHTRPRPLKGIPVRDYQSQPSSAKAETRSLIGLLLHRIDEPVVPVKIDGKLPARIRYFQLDRPKLVIDHCSIARVVLQIDETGNYKLNLRAEQNANFGKKDENGLPLSPKESDKFTEYLLRNQFFVRVRGLGLNPRAVEFPDLKPGAPVMFQIPQSAFWVQRAQPYHFERAGQQEDVRRYFDAVEVIEVEFWYR